jgi:hypothetical protein
MVKNILGGVKRLAGLPFLTAEALADFQAGFELGDFGRTDALDAAQFGNRRFVYPF